MKLISALTGMDGTIELNRVIGAAGALAYVVGAHVFVAWDLWRGQRFDVVAYCAAFPTGLGIAVGAIAGAVALKDRNVATARVIASTGGLPAAAPAPACNQENTDG